MISTVFYAYPIDLFERNADTKDIITAYESDVNNSREFPVLKLTPDELAEKINDEMFNNQEYWIRAVMEDRKDMYAQVEQLRKDLKEEIILTLKREGMDSILFSDTIEDYASAIWFDRHDFPNWSKINGLRVEETELVLLCMDDDVEITTFCDWGAQNISTLCDILYVVKETISQTPTLQMCAMMGNLMNSKGMETIEFVDEPAICVEGERKIVRKLTINPEGTQIRIQTDEDSYCFDLIPSEDTTLAFLENILRETGMESLLELAYYKIPNTPDPCFNSFISDSLTWL